MVKRGYGDGEVEHQLSRVDSLDRKDLLEYKNKTNKNNDRVPIVLTFSRGLPSVNKILRNRHQTLLNSDRLSEIFPKQPIIAFRRDKNLQERRQANDPVALHFCTNEHSIDDFTIIGLEKLYKYDMYRKNRENLWKKKLNTFYPYGINTKEI